MSQEHYATLVACLQDVPDPRQAQGRRYEWSYLVTLLALSLLAGQQRVRGMAQWVTERHDELVSLLQPRRQRVPSAATFHRLLRRIDVAALEAALARYTQTLDQSDGVTGRVHLKSGELLAGQALDGKTVCGASRQTGVHLVSLVRHERGAVLAQARVVVKLDERSAAHQLLVGEVMARSVTTLDALHTHRRLAEQIVRHGGHYLLVVKANQPTLYHEIAQAFSVLPPKGAWEQEFWHYACVEGCDKAHGRIERRLSRPRP